MKRAWKILCGLCIGILFMTSSRVAEAAEVAMDYSQLVVDSYEVVNGSLLKGEECTLRIHVTNIDDSSAVTAGGILINSSSLFPAEGKTNQVTFGRVEPGESFYVDFEVSLVNAIAGPNTVEIELNWVDENKVVYTNSANISPTVEGQATAHSQLMVDSYEFIEGKFERSAECVIRIYLKNISSSNAVVSGGVTIYSAYVFPVTGKTNQAALGVIAPGETTYVDFDVNLDNIVNGPNLIEVELHWEDETQVGYSNSVSISPVLLEKIGFEVTSVKAPEVVYGKMNTTMSVSYENTGAEDLQNVSMVIEGDIAQGMQVIELKDIDAKEKDMTDCSLELLNNGKNKIAISFKYEDRNGTEYNTEPVETNVTVTDKAYFADTEQKMSFNEFFTTYRVYIAAASVAIILWIPLVVSLTKKRGKKR